MSVGRQFIFSILTEEPREQAAAALRRALDAGINEESFLDEEDKNSWRFLHRHFLNYGQIPSVDVVEIELDTRFPDYAPDEPPQFWLDRLVEYNRNLFLDDTSTALNELLSEGKTLQAEQLLTEGYHKLVQFRGGRHVYNIFDLAEEAMDRHDQIQRGVVETGIPIGFPYIDTVTGGAQASDKWTIVGRPGTGKTYISCRMAVSCHAMGYRPLFVSMEMPGVQIARRNITMGAHVNNTALRLGHMSAFAMRRLREICQQLAGRARPKQFLWSWKAV